MSKMSEKTRETGEVSILALADRPESLVPIAKALQKEGLTCERTSSARAAVQLAREQEFDVIVVEMMMRDMTGLEFLKIVKAFHPETQIVLLDRSPSIRSAVNALSLGAFDYLATPVEADELCFSVQRALRKKVLKSESVRLPEPGQAEHSFNGIVGRSEQMLEVFRLISKVAKTNAPVIIQGESGTGKELVARAIHDNSLRTNQKFLAINSASLPETLLESELFGYRKGAFTGAHKDKMGLLESANRGTLLLDEIGSMSKQLQGKLLRAMQEGEVVPVGGTERVKVDVRVLAASNRNLWEMVELGEFRRELYYRLNVIEMTIPPLRDRKGDIALLAEHFLDKYCREEGVEQKVLGRPAARKLLRYNWPGNVRELENVIRRAVIVSSGKVVKASDIDLKRAVPADVSGRSDLLSMSYREAKKIVQGEFQKAYLRRMLSESGGSVLKVADRAGLSRQAVHEMLRKHGLKKRSSVRGRG